MRWVVVLVSCVWVAVAAAAPVFEEHFQEGEGNAPAGWQFLQQRGECAGVWDRTEPPEWTWMKMPRPAPPGPTLAR